MVKLRDMLALKGHAKERLVSYSEKVISASSSDKRKKDFAKFRKDLQESFDYYQL